MDALHFHRRVKNLTDARRKVCAASGAGEYPALHVALDERAFVFRSEQTEHQDFFALRAGCTFGESDGVANIDRHDFPLSNIFARERMKKLRLEKFAEGKQYARVRVSRWWVNYLNVVQLWIA